MAEFGRNDTNDEERLAKGERMAHQHGLYAGGFGFMTCLALSKFHGNGWKTSLGIAGLGLTIPYFIISHFSYISLRDRILFERKIQVMLKGEERRRKTVEEFEIMKSKK